MSGRPTRANRRPRTTSPGRPRTGRASWSRSDPCEAAAPPAERDSGGRGHGHGHGGSEQQPQAGTAVRLDLGDVGGPISLGFDVVPGGADGGRRPGSAQPDAEADYALVIDPSAGDAQMWVRAGLDPVPLDGLPPPDPRPPPVDGWVRQQLTLNKPRVVPTTGEKLDAEFLDVGALRHSEMDPDHPDYDSRATWRLDDRTIKLRIPWGLLGLSDRPQSRRSYPVRTGLRGASRSTGSV